MNAKAPADAVPRDRAASIAPDRVAEQKGVIVVPEQPYTDLWKGYVVGDPGVEAVLVQMARDRRTSLETKGRYL